MNYTRIARPSSLVLLLGAAAILTACQSDRAAAEKAVKEVLKDPDSARFGDFYFNEQTGEGCLGVNAKNSMGGYTGEQQAVLYKEDGEWRTGVTMEISHADCKSMADMK